MAFESEHRAILRLSREDARVFDDPQIGALMRGIKPAVYLGWHSDATRAPDLAGIRDALAERGIKAVVLPSGLIADTSQIARRLAEEPELARLVGWDEARSIEENVSRPEATAPGDERNHGLLAFMLGYPRSSIESFRRLSELGRRGVPTNWKDFFLPPQTIPTIRAHVRDGKGVEVLERLQEAGHAYAQTKRAAMDAAASREDRMAANDAHWNSMRRHLDEIRSLYRDHWNLDEADIDLILERRGIRIYNAAGQELYFFSTHGAGSESHPDVLALERRIESTEGPITKTVSNS